MIVFPRDPPPLTSALRFTKKEMKMKKKRRNASSPGVSLVPPPVIKRQARWEGEREAFFMLYLVKPPTIM